MLAASARRDRPCIARPGDILSVVRGWGHPLDSWPGCLPGYLLDMLLGGHRQGERTIVAEPFGR
jgi:hypothetical protein